MESGIEIGLEGVTESGGWRMESDGEWYKSAVGSCCELEVWTLRVADARWLMCTAVLESHLDQTGQDPPREGCVQL